MDPNKFWKWGIFYVNREDPKTFRAETVLVLTLFAIALPLEAPLVIIEALRGRFNHYVR